MPAQGDKLDTYERLRWLGPLEFGVFAAISVVLASTATGTLEMGHERMRHRLHRDPVARPREVECLLVGFIPNGGEALVNRLQHGLPLKDVDVPELRGGDQRCVAIQGQQVSVEGG